MYSQHQQVSVGVNTTTATQRVLGSPRRVLDEHKLLSVQEVSESRAVFLLFFSELHFRYVVWVGIAQWV